MTLCFYFIITVFYIHHILRILCNMITFLGSRHTCSMISISWSFLPCGRHTFIDIWELTFLGNDDVVFAGKFLEKS